MVRISILYPNSPGARFDWRYYVETHMPRSIDLLSAHPGFRGVFGRARIERLSARFSAGLRGDVPFPFHFTGGFPGGVPTPC